MQSNQGSGSSAKDIYGQKFMQMAQASFNGSHPREQQFVEGFHLVDADPDESVACGIFILRLGEREAHVPAVLNKNDLSPYDVMYLPDSEVFVPFNLDWMNLIKNGSPGTLGEAKKPPKTMSNDVDIRNIMMPPASGRYSYASASAAPLLNYLSRASNEKRAKARNYLSHPKRLKIAQYLFGKYGADLEDVLRPTKLAAAAGLSEDPVLVLTTDDTSDAFRGVFRQKAATAYLQASEDGCVILDLRPATKIAMAAEGVVKMTEIAAPGLYRMHLRDGSTRMVYVTDRHQALDKSAQETGSHGTPSRGKVTPDQRGPYESRRVTSSQFVILTDKGELCLWNDASSTARPVVEIVDLTSSELQSALSDITTAFNKGPIRQMRPQDRYYGENTMAAAAPVSFNADDAEENPDAADEELRAELGVFVRLSSSGTQLELSQPFCSLWNISKDDNGQSTAMIQVTDSGYFGAPRGTRIVMVSDPNGDSGIKLYGPSAKVYSRPGTALTLLPDSFMMITGKQLDSSLVPTDMGEVRDQVSVLMDKEASAVVRVTNSGADYMLQGRHVGGIKEAARKLTVEYGVSGISATRMLKIASRRSGGTVFRVFSQSSIIKLAADPATEGATTDPTAEGQLAMDPNTGLLVDQASGQMFDPNTGEPVDPSQVEGPPGAPPQGQPGMPPGMPPQGPTPMDIAAQDVLTLLQAQTEEIQRNTEQQLMMSQAQVQAVQTVLQRAQQVAQGQGPLGYQDVRGMVAMPTAQPAPLDTSGFGPPPQQPMQGAPLQQPQDPNAPPMPQPTEGDLAAAQFTEEQQIAPEAVDLSVMAALAEDGKEDELVNTQIPAFVKSIDTAARTLVDLRLKRDRVVEALGDSNYRATLSNLVKVIKLLGEVTLRLNQQAALMNNIQQMEGVTL